MAVLTWRNVDAPNFSGAIDGIRTASMLLNNATDAARAGIADFTKSREESGDRALLDYVQGIQDPAAMTQALASDPRLRELRQRASVNAIRQLDSRPGDLIARSLQQEALAKESFNNARYRTGMEALDANGAVVNRALMAERGGNTASAEDMAALQSLRPDLFSRVLGDLNTQADSGLDRRKTAQDMVQSAGRYNMDIRNDTEARQGQALAMRVASDSLTIPDAVAQLDASGASPQVRAIALRQLQGMGFSGMYAPVSAAGTGGAGGGTASLGSAPTYSSGFTFGAPQQQVARALSSAGLPDNVVAGFLGNFHAEGGYDGAKGDGGSAAGIAQWRGERQANFRKVIGKDVTAATPEEQARFVKWELDNPGRAGMSVAQRDRILAAKSPEEAAELIDEIYERSSGEHRSRRVAAATDAAKAMGLAADPGAAILNTVKERAATGVRAANNETSLNQAIGRTYSGTISNRLPELAADKRSDALDVAQKLIKDKAISEQDAGTVMAAINKIIQDSGGRISAPVAGGMIRNNLTKADGAWSRAGSVIADVLGAPFGRATSTDNLSNGLRINDAGLRAEVDAYLNEGINTQTAAGRNQEAELAVLNNLEQQYQAAEAAYQTMRSAAMGRSPAAQQAVERYRVQRDLALAAFQEANAQLERSDRTDTRLDFDVTTPEPKPVAVTVGGQPVQSGGGQQALPPYDEMVRRTLESIRNR